MMKLDYSIPISCLESALRTLLHSLNLSDQCVTRPVLP